MQTDPDFDSVTHEEAIDARTRAHTNKLAPPAIEVGRKHLGGTSAAPRRHLGGTHLGGTAGTWGEPVMITYRSRLKIDGRSQPHEISRRLPPRAEA